MNPNPAAYWLGWFVVVIATLLSMFVLATTADPDDKRWWRRFKIACISILLAESFLIWFRYYIELHWSRP